MNNNIIQLRQSVIYGAVFGAIIILLQFLSAVLCVIPNKAITSLVVPVFIIGAFLGTRNFRDKFNNGYITFGKAFGNSLLICITIGTIWGLYRFLLFKYISPELMNVEIEESQEAMLNAGWNEKFVELASSNLNPVTMGFGYITNSAIYGSLLSLIIAAILKRNFNPLLVDNDQNL
jgi:hypothetical protein